MGLFGPSKRELRARVAMLEDEVRLLKSQTGSLNVQLNTANRANRELQGSLQAARKENTELLQRLNGGLVPKVSQAVPKRNSFSERRQQINDAVYGAAPAPRIATEEAVATQVLPVIAAPVPEPPCHTHSAPDSHCHSHSCGGHSNSCGGASSSCGGGGGD